MVRLMCLFEQCVWPGVMPDVPRDATRYFTFDVKKAVNAAARRARTQTGGQRLKQSDVSHLSRCVLVISCLLHRRRVSFILLANASTCTATHACLHVCPLAGQRQGRRGDDRRNNDERRERRQGSFSSADKSSGRERLPDPNSPFAKLLALKEQLENRSKT